MYKKLKELNVLVLVVIGILPIKFFLVVVARWLLSRIMSYQVLISLNKVNQGISWILNIGLFVLLVLIVYQNFKYNRLTLMKGLACVNLLLFALRQVVTWVYIAHIGRVIAKEQSMFFGNASMGEYVGYASTLVTVISGILFLIIGILTIVQLSYNKKA